MLRLSHSWPGLAAGLLVVLLALSGVFLSVQPMLETASAARTPAQAVSVAALAESVKTHHSEIDKIVRRASGMIVLNYFEDGRPGASIIDPATGAVLGPQEPTPITRFITNLHRSLLLGSVGRVAAGVSAAIMLLLAVSGLLLLLRRQGGWCALLRPIRGERMGRWHAELGRLATIGLLLSALTGCYLSLVSFEWVSDGTTEAVAPLMGSGGPRLAPGDVPLLRATDITVLRELTLPYAADLTDPITLTTDTAVTQIDAATGEILVSTPHSFTRQAYELFYMLHTGQGLWPLALLLGLCALAVPAFAVTGTLVWWQKRGARPKFAGQVAAAKAGTIVFVGSEGGSTWAFAQTLHAALAAAGHKVHGCAMNELGPEHLRAKRWLILAATFGDGDAPSSASQFMSRLRVVDGAPAVAVLGFGDRNFPRFCAYAETVALALRGKGHPELLPLTMIDPQSAQAFAEWGVHLNKVLGDGSAQPLGAGSSCGLAANGDVRAGEANRLRRTGSGSNHGFDIRPDTAGWPQPILVALAGAAAALFRGGRSGWHCCSRQSCPALLFVGVIRCRRRSGNLCAQAGGRPVLRISAWLAARGAYRGLHQVQSCLRPKTGATPVILIGAGAGIAPLIGFVHANTAMRPMHLYWGGWTPDSDFLYRDVLAVHVREGRLSSFAPVFSRSVGGGYVQKRILDDADTVRRGLADGAQILVCGARGMATGVRQALDLILQPTGQSVTGLRAAGLYVEDVY
jgi:sulfite reductase (NADPH) flavoprotein alpha-component